jgi:hypothetical protein
MLKKIDQSKILGLVFFAALCLVVGGWIWAYVALHKLTADTPLILHFDDLEGITAVGTFGTIMFMGILGTVAVVMNFLIALELEARDRFLGKLIAAITFIFAALLFIGFVAIISVN